MTDQHSQQPRHAARSLVGRREVLRFAGGALTAGFAASVLDACGNSVKTPPAGGAKYPTRPINVIVGYGAGGGSDQLARTVTPFAAKKLGVSMPVENDPGGNGAIGLAKCAAASPDGYTIGTYIADNTGSLAFGGEPWNLSQLVGVCRLMLVPSFYFVNSKSSYKTIQDVISAAKAKPGSIRVGTVGEKSVDVITCSVVEHKTGARFKLVPFSKPADRYKSLLNNEVDMLYEQGGDVQQYIRGGQFRPLVIFSETTFAPFPKVPTSKSLGWPVYFPQYRGIVAPAGTPKSVRQKLFTAFQGWSKSSSYQQFAKVQYMSPDSFQGPDFFQRELQQDITTLKKFIKEYPVLG